MNKSDTGELFDTNGKNEGKTAKTSSAVQGVKNELAKLKSEVERLEEFSRPDNLRMFGVPHSGTSLFEDYDTCTRAVTEALNSVAGPKRWTTDDITRA